MRHALRRVRIGVLLSVLLVSTAAAPDQQPEKTVVQERAAVTVIEVPVTVLGKDGEPLAGLTAANFELYDRGKKQEISGFDVVDLRQVAAPTAENPLGEAPPPAARRHWLLVFDLSYSSPTGLVRARDGARAFVEKDMSPFDLAGVGTLSVESGWKLLENFTNDRSQLVQAIDTLGIVQSGIRTSDPLGFVYVLPTPGGQPQVSTKEAALLEDLKDFQRLQQAASDSRERERVAKQMTSLGRMAQLLDSVRGRKQVLFFSEGFESRLLTGNAGQFASPLGQTSLTQDNAPDAATHGEIWKIDSDARFSNSATRGFLVDTMASFRRSDVVLHTVDISGLRADSEVGYRAGSGTDALFTIANETNGDLIRNANRLSGALKQLTDRTALVYVLAFQLKSLDKPGTFHELKVKVNVPTSKVTFRSGYYEPRPYRSLSPIERMLASGDLLTGGGTTQLPVHMLVAPFASGGKVSQIPVILEIPGKSLLEGETAASSQVQIYTYASDTNGTLADFLTQEMSLDLKLLRPRLEGGGIKYYGTVFLPPGRFILRTLVRSVTTGRSGLATSTLTVPAIPGGDPTVLPPFFHDSADTWIMVKSNPRANAPAPPPEYPFEMEGKSFIPAALPVIGGGTPVEVSVVAFNFSEGEKAEPLQLLAEVVGSDGKLRKVDVQTIRRSDRERNGARALLLSLKPEGLEPGHYVLRVRASDRVTRRTASATSSFEVRSP